MGKMNVRPSCLETVKKNRASTNKENLIKAFKGLMNTVVPRLTITLLHDEIT